MKDRASWFDFIVACALLCVVAGCDVPHPHGIFPKVDQIKVGMTPKEVQDLIEGRDNSSDNFQASAKNWDTKAKWEYMVTGRQEFGEDGTELPFNGSMTWIGKHEHNEAGHGLTVTFMDGKATKTEWHQLEQLGDK